jgi:hypothetical protein
MHLYKLHFEKTNMNQPHEDLKAKKKFLTT